MSQDQENSQSSMGKWMFAFAWLMGIFLLTLLFDDLLLERFNPNSEPASYVVGNSTEVRLKQNDMGHYVVSGTINRQPVIFLLDTGATDVSIPAHLADELGLLPGARQRAMTANGSVIMYQTHIDELSIGEIQLGNVDGNLNPGMRSDKILLGMSALKQLEFSQKDGWLVLRTP